jgi:hypothetical protein
MSIPTKNMIYVRYDNEPVAKITINNESDININWFSEDGWSS